MKRSAVRQDIAKQLAAEIKLRKSLERECEKLLRELSLLHGFIKVYVDIKNAATKKKVKR